MRVLFIGSFFKRQTFIVFIGKLNRANIGAFITAGTLGEIHKAGLLFYPGGKAPLLPIKAQKFAVG